jgi:hypothetical protein
VASTCAAAWLQAVLLPTFHTSYWLGLTSNATAWPSFSWLDPYMAPLASGSVYR